MISMNQKLFFQGNWEFSNPQSIRPQPIQWYLESNEAYFCFSHGNHKIEIRFPHQTLTDKKWEGRYTILRKLGESIEPNAREGGQVRFDYKDGIWKGNPSGYACTINWFVKKMP